MILENLYPQKIQHDLGLLANSAAIIAAYPTGRPGDFVRNTATGTLWNWNGAAWFDTGVSFEGSSATPLKIVTATGNNTQKTFTVTGLADTDELMVFAGTALVDEADYTRTPGGGQVVFTTAPYNEMKVKFLF